MSRPLNLFPLFNTLTMTINILHVIRKCAYHFRRLATLPNNVRSRPTLFRYNTKGFPVRHVTNVNTKRSGNSITLRPLIRVTMVNRLMVDPLGNDLRPRTRHTKRKDNYTTGNRSRSRIRASRPIVLPTTHVILRTGNSLVRQTLRNLRRLLHVKIVTRGSRMLTPIYFRSKRRVNRLPNLRHSGRGIVRVLKNRRVYHLRPVRHYFPLRRITSNRTLLIGSLLPLTPNRRNSRVFLILYRAINRLATLGTYTMRRSPRGRVPPILRSRPNRGRQTIAFSKVEEDPFSRETKSTHQSQYDPFQR